MAQALYRKYRPLTLGEVVGQEHITSTLARAVGTGRISHAYLFTGLRGSGKTSVARILAHEINNLPYGETHHLDIIEIDAASNRRIDDIRDLREKVHITPITAAYKVYIIDEVHMLTGESFNALLKTLEEPPKHVVFILATTEVHKLPATIISRTQRFSFRPVHAEKVAAHLRTIASKEEIDIDDDALRLVAAYGEGSFRDSISLLDQLSHVASGTITTETIVHALGLAPQAKLDKLIDSLLSGDRQAVATQLAALETEGTTPTALVPQLARVLAAAALTKPGLYDLIDALLDVPRAYHPSLKLLTTLMRHTGSNRSAASVQAPSSPSAAPPPAPTKPTPKTKPSADKKSDATPKNAVAGSAPTPSSVLQNEMTVDQWSRIMNQIKLVSPPLFGVLKQAQPHFDIAQNTLTVAFKYALHSKKIEDGKQKLLLLETIQATLGVSPLITTAIDKNVVPPVITDDPTVASVAAIMGGGEVIDAEAI